MHRPTRSPRLLRSRSLQVTRSIRRLSPRSTYLERLPTTQLSLKSDGKMTGVEAIGPKGRDSWFVNDIPLQNGSNTLTVTATDSGGNTGVATLTVISGSPALAINSAVSRKTHGSAGAFDINVLSGEVECRTGGPSGNDTIVVTFDNPIVSGNAAVTAGIGSVIGTPTVSGNTMTVNLTEVANAQNLTVTLNNVTDSFSHVLSDTPVSMTTLVGDTTGNKLVTSSDVSQTKLQSGQAVTTSNFREDINASGTINGTDVSIAKSNVGSGAP